MYIPWLYENERHFGGTYMKYLYCCVDIVIRAIWHITRYFLPYKSYFILLTYSV